MNKKDNIKKWEQELDDNVNLESDNAIKNLFIKYEKDFEPEFNEENWIDFHQKGDGGMNAIRESIELIGDGEIIDKSDVHLIYKELFKDDSLILIVHAKLQKSPHGGQKGYYYEIGVYRNEPKINQTKLLDYIDYDIIHYNRNVISKVCDDIKTYAINNY